jgi:hypothetical protein
MRNAPYRKSEPTQSDAHIDEVLTNISIAYMQDESNFVAPRVFPTIPVDKQSNKYWTFTKNDWFRDEAEKRADNTPSVGSGYTLSTDSYYCDVWAFHRDLGSQLRANADAVLRLEANASRFVTQRLLLRQEIQWAADYFTTSVWANDVTPAALWSDYATSDPIEDVETGKEAILSVTGHEANTLVLGYQVFRKLKNHPDFRDRIKYTSSDNVTAELLARVFEVERVLVCKAIKATNIKGATGAYGFVHGKHALLCHVAASPAPETPSAGYHFAWTGIAGGNSIAMDAFDIRETKTRRVEGEMAWDNKVTGSDLGYFFNGAVA